MRKTKKTPTIPKKSGKNSPSTGKKIKKKNRRELATNPNLDPKYNLKSRTKLLDQDYLHKLNSKELAWLNKFNAEYINAGKELKKENKPFHRTKKLRKDCYDRNNSRNRDILTKQEAMGTIQNIDDPNVLERQVDILDELEQFIDLKKQGYLDEKGEFTLTLDDFEDKDE